MLFLYVVLSLFALLITKNKMTADFHHLTHKIGGNQHTAVIIWSIFFLPGTIIHEISHLLAAGISGARTGKIQIFPEYLEDERHVSLGSLETQKLNIIQGFLVGFAPLITGLVLLLLLATSIQDSFINNKFLLLILEGYLFFNIANSFFPSPKDIKHTLPFVIIFFITTFLALHSGFQIILSSNSYIFTILDSLWKAIGLSSFLNLATIGILNIFYQIASKRQ